MVWQNVVKYEMKMMWLNLQEVDMKTAVLYTIPSKYAVVRTSKRPVQSTLWIIENVNERLE
jgi:hypothetical protein